MTPKTNRRPHTWAKPAFSCILIDLCIKHLSEGRGCVWKKDVWDFQVSSQTFLEVRFSLGYEGKDGKNLNSQTWGLELPDVLPPDICDHPILKTYQYSAEEQDFHQNLAPVLVIISGILWYFFYKNDCRCWFFTGAAPRRVSTGTGKNLVSHNHT